MNKKLGLLLALCTGFAAAFAGCGSTNDSAYYSGTWSGTINNVTTQNPNLYLTLYQTGSTLTGDFLATASASTTAAPPISGTVTGSVSGSSLALVFTILAGEDFIGGTGTTSVGQLTTQLAMSGTLTLNNTSLTGSLSGTNSTPAINLTQVK